MNINIVSFYFGNNYGALLQCYYLRKFLKKIFQIKKFHIQDINQKN